MTESDSKSNGKGFAVRMIVLLVLLGLVAAGFFYDRQMTSSADTKINGLMNTLMARKAGKGLSPQDVQEEFGFAPSETKKVDKYNVEKYEFSRLLPFSKGQFVTVVYNQDQVHTAMANKEFDPNATSDLMKQIKTTPQGERTNPESQLSGGGDPGLEGDGQKADDKEGDDKEGDDKEGDDKKDDDKEGGDKEDDDKEGDDKGDGQEGDKKDDGDE